MFTLSLVIPPHIIDKIFDVAAIEEVVGEYVSLKKAGANYKGLCPFHDDKNPSMSVSPSKGIFKCFSCGQGGNVFHFVMEHEGLSYPLAVKFLADKYNIQIEESDLNITEIEEEGRRKDGIYAALEFAKNFFHERLMSGEDGRVIYKPYLQERGFREESLKKFSIGLSGTSRSDMLNAGLTKGFTAQQLFDAGLVKKIDDNQGVLESNLRDTFIERIVFPIINISNKVLGFGGRIIKTDVKAPKYLNSPESIVYEKRKELYGLNFAKNSIRKSETVYVVEGYMDVLSLSQSGVENVVAVSGTAFTEEQARLLKRFSTEAILLFDGDEAGINASLKHINTLLKFDINTKIVLFPADEDPDSFIQKHGKQGFDDYVAKEAKDFVNFIAAVKLKGKENDPVAKATVGRLITESIAHIPDPLKRAAFINEAATSLGWQERILIEETNKFRVSQLKQKNSGSEVYVPSIASQPQEIEQKKDIKNYQEYDLLKTLILFADKEFNEEANVANFIFKELEEEDLWPETPEVMEIFKLAKEHLSADGVLDQMFFVRNPLSSRIAADLISGGYTLSEGWESRYDKFIPTDEENYKKLVVENLNYLKLNKIDKAIKENQAKLKEELEDDDILNHQLVDIRLKELRKRIIDQIGTVVLK